MDDIKDLETKDDTSIRLYNNVKEIVDHSTGETTTIISSFLRREKTKDDFIKLFAENIDYLNENLSNPALRVIFMMMKNLNYQNIFRYDSEFVAYFVEKNILGKSSVYRAIKELEKKRVIFKLSKEQRDEFDVIGTNSFIINPQLIGKGSFRDIKKLRQTVTKTFDFDKLEMKQEMRVESVYVGFENAINNPNKFQIEKIEEIENGKNIGHKTIISERKNNSQPQNYHVIDVRQGDKTANSDALMEHKEPSLFDEPISDKATHSVIFKLTGILNGVIDPNITAKEIKAQRLSKYE